MGNRICNIQYIDNILQYMQYSNILLPEANIAIYMVCQRRILQYIWCIALRGYNILQYCSIWLQCIATLLNTSSPCFDAYIYNYTRYIRFKATSIYNVAFTNAFTHPFVYIYAYSNASHIWSTTFIQPICAKINRAYRCVYIQPYTLRQI